MSDGQIDILVKLDEEELRAGLSRMNDAIQATASRGQNIFSRFGESIRNVGSGSGKPGKR